MKYITSQEASALWGITPRRIQQMCKSGEIKGAKKEGKSWIIPENAVFSTETTEDTNNSSNDFYEADNCSLR